MVLDQQKNQGGFGSIRRKFEWWRFTRGKQIAYLTKNPTFCSNRLAVNAPLNSGDRQAI
jgi:hypothetical protein